MELSYDSYEKIMRIYLRETITTEEEGKIQIQLSLVT